MSLLRSVKTPKCHYSEVLKLRNVITPKCQNSENVSMSVRFFSLFFYFLHVKHRKREPDGAHGQLEGCNRNLRCGRRPLWQRCTRMAKVFSEFWCTYIFGVSTLRNNNISEFWHFGVMTFRSNVTAPFKTDFSNMPSHYNTKRHSKGPHVENMS